MQASPEVKLVSSARLRQVCRLDQSPPDDLVSLFSAVQIAPDSTTGTGTSGSASIATASGVPATTVPSPVSVGSLEEDTVEREYVEFGREEEYGGSDRDRNSGQDFTACSADDCGYCGQCPY